MKSSKFNELKPQKAKSSVDRKRVMAFLDRQGFYIVLLLCLGIIGLTTFLALNGNSGSEQAELTPAPTMEQAQPVEKDVRGGLNEQLSEQLTVTPTPQASLPTPTTQASAAATPAAEAAAPTPTPQAEAPKAENKSSAPTVTVPVEGEVGMGYASGELVYSETLKQWTTHSGVDVKAKEGAPVKAAMSGAVLEVYKDKLMGNIIILEHEDKVKTVYAGLLEQSTLKKGDKVKSGQEIGKVGMSASGEVAEGAHLHFEILIDGKAKDPGDYISAYKKAAAQTQAPQPSAE